MLKHRRRTHGSRGAALVLLVFLIPVVLAIAAFSINLVYMEMTRTELQIATDVATRAAGRVLAVTGDKQLAIDAAQRYAIANRVGNQPLNLATSDILFGISTRLSEDERYSFTAGKNPNAVRIEPTQFSEKTGSGLPMLFPTMGLPAEFRPIKTAISTTSELDIALVVDRSGSMAYADDEVASQYNPAAAPPAWNFGDAVPPNARWLNSVEAISGFLRLISVSNQDERISLSTYSSKSSTDVKATGDYAQILSALNERSAAFVGGATNIGDGILEGASALSDKKLSRPWATRVMIVLTDGTHNIGTDPLMAASQAAKKNIMMFTISFSNEANQSQMKEVATIGAGKHFHAVSGEELANAFTKISQSLPTLITF